MNTRQSERLFGLGGMARLTALVCVGAVWPMVVGCQSPQSVPPNPRLRVIELPQGGTPTDFDRAALTRLTGMWNFDGWSCAEGAERRNGSGRARGAIENDHFMLVDLKVTSGEAAGRFGHRMGSMMFASEPGVGVTMTMWGDGSPSMGRFVGHTEGAGSAFILNEARTPPDIHRLKATISFETDDRWTIEMRDVQAKDKPLIASYTFTRATN